MSDSIQLYFDNDGKAKIYDDTYDIAIHCETEEEYDKAMQMLKRAKEMQWIPCSERLPEEYGEYRITWTTSMSKKPLIGDAEYEVSGEWDSEHDRFKGEWLLADYVNEYPDVKVTAWKPMEEPYQPEEESE